MIVCPLCENQQAQGITCEVCGRALPGAAVAAQGHQDAPVAPMEGLEQTARAAPDRVRVPAIASDSPCVWCGHRQVVGVLCDACGMQRHRGALEDTSAAGGEEATEVHCGDCGLPGPPAGRCRGCGAKMPTGLP